MTEEREKHAAASAVGRAQRPDEGRLPFDRAEWARLNQEADDSLRRQYGREARSHADD